MNDKSRITEIPGGDDLVWFGDDECNDHADSLVEWIAARIRDEAEIEAGRIVYVADRERPDTSQFLPDFDLIVDQIADAAYDHGNEHAEDYPEFDDVAAARAELESLLAAWAKKHIKEPTFWLCENVREYVITQDDIDAATGES